MPGDFFIIATHLVYVQRIGIFKAHITMETSQINKPWQSLVLHSIKEQALSGFVNCMVSLGGLCHRLRFNLYCTVIFTVTSAISGLQKLSQPAISSRVMGDGWNNNGHLHCQSCTLTWMMCSWDWGVNNVNAEVGIIASQNVGIKSSNRSCWNWSYKLLS